jgi:hypothetical protein
MKEKLKKGKESLKCKKHKKSEIYPTAQKEKQKEKHTYKTRYFI